MSIETLHRQITELNRVRGIATPSLPQFTALLEQNIGQAVEAAFRRNESALKAAVRETLEKGSL